MFPSISKKSKKKTSSVDFINILHACFLYEILAPLNYKAIKCKWKKAAERLLCKKCLHKMLIKLTPELPSGKEVEEKQFFFVN